MGTVTVFPAQAGMIPGMNVTCTCQKCVPRAGGDDPSGFVREVVMWTCSPRRRG